MPKSTRRTDTTRSCSTMRATTRWCAPTSTMSRVTLRRRHERPMNRSLPVPEIADRADLEATAAWVAPGANVLACVKNSVNVIQSDLEAGLAGFDAGSFDYVILSQTLQAMRRTEEIIMEMLRVGRQGIVSFPNFGYWPQRLQMMRGRMPLSDVLPYEWFNTPNVHLCTLADFEDFCTAHGVRILERIVMQGDRRIRFAPNLRGSVAVYRFEKA